MCFQSQWKIAEYFQFLHHASHKLIDRRRPLPLSFYRLVPVILTMRIVPRSCPEIHPPECAENAVGNAVAGRDCRAINRGRVEAVQQNQLPQRAGRRLHRRCKYSAWCREISRRWLEYVVDADLRLFAR